MKILKIELQNINSLKSDSPIIIDFENEAFSSTGLFAITGPTGSGKTTILDAITIALYREVPRFNASHIKLGLSDVISEGAGEASARVIFKNEGKIYDAYWNLRIKSKSGKDINPVETVRLTEIPTGKILAEKKTEYLKKIEEITKLNYHQFLRSMMLAQGEFASFLKASKNEKVALLDQIIGNDIYKRIGEETLKRLVEEKNKQKEIEAKINTDELLSDEQKNDLEKEKEEILINLKKLESEKKKFSTIINWYEQYKALQKQKEKLEQSIIAFEKQKQEKTEVLIKLELHKKAKPFEKNLHDIQNAEKEILTKQDELKNINPEIDTIKNEIKSIIEILEKSEKQLRLTQNEFHKWMPKLDEVTKLDEKIISKTGKFEELQKIIVELNSNIKNDTEIKTRKSNELTELTTGFNNLKIVIEKNAHLEKIDSLFAQWSVNLNNRKYKYDSIEKTKKEIQKLNARIDKLNNDIEKTNNELSLKKEILKKSNAVIIKLQKETTGFKLDELHNKQNEINQKLQNLSEASRLSKDYSSKQIEISELKKTISDLKEKKINFIDEEQQILNQIKTEQKFLEEIEQRLKLEQKIKNVEEERAKLQEGKACPVCGSTHHPFVMQYRDYDFSTTEKKYKEQKYHLEKLRKQKESLSNQLTEIETKLENETNKILNTTDEVHKIVTDYEKLHTEIGIGHIGEIAKNITHTKNKKREITEAFKKASELQEKLNKTTGEYNALKDEISNYERLLSKYNAEKESAENNIAEKTGISKELNADIKNLEDALESELLQFDMQLPELHNTKYFLQSLQEEINEYKRNIEHKNKLKNEIGIIKTEIKNLEQSIGQQNEKISSTKKEEQSLEIEISKTKNNRNEILPLEVSVPGKRKELNDKKQKAETVLTESKNKLNDLKLKLTEKETRKETLESDLKKSQKDIDKFNEELSQKLFESEFTGKDELKSALLDAKTEKEYTEIDKNINDKEIELKTKTETINENEQKMEESRNFDMEEDEAKKKINNIEQEIEEYQKRSGAISEKFANDERIRMQNVQIMKEIDLQKRIVKKWKVLFELLGGSKESFNIYVQRLTLKSLIKHANLHLNKLSDRYSLQLAGEIKDNKELNIELVDHYQTNIVRPVETCSGGESFLLSLSLALGLSDMASRNVKVESLFIDEGFGTLDDDLLEMVISTLETLQSSGKIIGIISHVEKLKERITTQIQVRKIGNGVSEVLIA